MTTYESPSLANVLFGLGGLGARGAASVGRAGMRPGAALARTGWRALAPGPVTDRIDGALRTLDTSGQRDAEQARDVLLGRATTAANWVLDGVLGSPQADRLLERVVESDEFWRVVERVVYSEELVDVLTRSRIGAGLAAQVAGEARRRTVSADDSAERIARRLLRRNPPSP